MSAPIPPGWYDDGTGQLTYWDGGAWVDTPRAKRPWLIALIGGAAALAVAVGAGLALTLGNNNDDDAPPPQAEPTPGEVAEAYLKAETSGQFSKACEMETEELRKHSLVQFGVGDCPAFEVALRDSSSWRIASELIDHATYEIAIEEVDDRGTEATVQYRQDFTYHGSSQLIVESVGEYGTRLGTIEMVKTDGVWLVASDTEVEPGGTTAD